MAMAAGSSETSVMFRRLHGVTSQKTAIIIITESRNSNLETKLQLGKAMRLDGQQFMNREVNNSLINFSLLFHVQGTRGTMPQAGR
jgi:hypothetical protein